MGDAVDVDAVAMDAGVAATVVAMVGFTPPMVTVTVPFNHATTLSHIPSPSIHTHTHTRTPNICICIYIHQSITIRTRSIGSYKTYRNAYILDRIITTYVHSSF